MLIAHDPISGDLYSGEDAKLADPHNTGFAKGFRCLDPNCAVPLIWRPGNNGVRPNWAHKNATNCAGSRMSKKHKLMQDSLVSLPFWSYAKKEQAIKVPQNKLRTCSTRVIDVATKFNVPAGSASVSLECQHSSTHLLREENRIQDHNLAGLPVFMFVSSDAVRDVGNGRALVRYWVRDRARRHGRQQFASIDDNGDIWWCWLDPAYKNQMRSAVPLERVRLDLGALSPTDPRWRLGVGVDASTPNQRTGKPSLLIAAPCWESTLPAESRMRPWPPKATTARKFFQPKYFPKTMFMGYPGVKALFGPGAIVHGGF